MIEQFTGGQERQKLKETQEFKEIKEFKDTGRGGLGMDNWQDLLQLWRMMVKIDQTRSGTVS